MPGVRKICAFSGLDVSKGDGMGLGTAWGWWTLPELVGKETRGAGHSLVHVHVCVCTYVCARACRMPALACAHTLPNGAHTSCLCTCSRA